MLFVSLLTFSLLGQVLPHSPPSVCAIHPSDCVDTRRGTDSHRAYSKGNTFPATSMPFGFNMWTPITEPDTSRWLYAYGHPSFLGMGLTHQASPWMGDYGTLHVSAVLDTPHASPKRRGVAFDHAREKALPYRYAVTLNNEVHIELVPTQHAAMMTFTYPEGHEKYLIIDTIRGDQGQLHVDAAHNTIEGTLTSRDWSGTERAMYVFARLDEAAITGVERLAGRPVGVAIRLLHFGLGPVTLKMGTSWIGPEEARFNLDDELWNVDFKEAKKRARAAWDEALGAIEVAGGTEETQKIYVNNLYRTLLYPNAIHEGHPSRYRSPYDGAVYSGEMAVNNGFWDTYRAVWPLHFLLRPEAAGRMLNGFAQAYAQSGWTPRWSAPGHSAQMVGTHTDAVFADAFVKGIRNFDTELAWASAVKNATAVSPDDAWGRPANNLAQYLGFVPTDEVPEAASWHLENCINDYALSAWARSAHKPDAAAYFGQRAQSYVNLFDAQEGFFRGRSADGAWRKGSQPFSPVAWGWEFTEGSPWHYLAPAPFDALGTAGLYGSTPQALADKIDALFDAAPGYEVGGYGRVIHEMEEAKAVGLGQYAHPNEPVHHLVWLYNAVGTPERAHKRLRQILDPNQGLYTLGEGTGGGWLGDEDNGQMSAWYVFAAAGLYPASPGIPEYFIGSPVFDRVTIHVPNSKTFSVVAENNSPANIYVQRAFLNGVPYAHSFIAHDAVQNGGALHLVMGPEPSLWGHAPSAWPTSQSISVKAPRPLADVTRGQAAAAAEPADRETARLTDDDSGTVWRAASSQATLTFPQVPATTELLQYTLTCGGGGPDVHPAMWRLEGSQDGATWHVLDSRDTETFDFPFQLRAFVVRRPRACSHLRLVVAAASAAAQLELAEIELLAVPSP